MLQTLAKILIAPILFVMSLAGYGVVDKNETPLGATLPIAGQTYTLYGSGVSSSATSITLSSFTLPQTGYKILDADVSSTFYITLEPGNRTKQEIVSCTTVTQNANDTATLSGCTRGLMPISPYTATSSYAFPHAGGSSVIFSNPPQFYNQFLAADNDGTITGIYAFSTSPTVPTPTAADQATPKSYIDGIAIAGAPTMSTSLAGIAKLSTTSASTTNPIVVGDNDTRVSPVSLATVTAGQVAGLAGTSGTAPSSTNKFVDNSDTSTTSVANKVVRYTSTGQISATTTPVATTDVTSKAYVDSQLARKNGLSQSPSTNSTQTIAHGLGRIPKKISLISRGVAYNGYIGSDGAYDGATTSSIYTVSNSATASYNGSVATSSTNVIYMQYSNSFNSINNYAYATTSVDATNINLSWTSNSIYPFMWEAE